MKKIFAAFFICFLALPCIAVPGEYTVMPDGTRICDNSDFDEYMNKLREDYFQRHKDGNINGENYTKEVMLPYFKFTGERQKQGHCGFKD